MRGAQLSDKTPQVVCFQCVSSRKGWRGSFRGSKAAQSRQAGGVAVVDLAAFEATGQESTHGGVGSAACTIGPRGRGRNFGSGLRVFCGFELAGEVESQLAEPPAQGLAGNPQSAGGLMLIPTRLFQDAGEQEAVHLAVGLRIKVARMGAEAEADEHLEAGIFRRGLCAVSGLRGSSVEGGQEGREQSRAAGVAAVPA